MGRFVAGQNVTYFAYESGTYGTVSGTGQWVGQVQNFEPNDTENVITTRYHGTETRNVDTFIPGNRDYGGTITYYPQDFKFLMFALGNGSDTTTGSPAYYTHTLTELESDQINPMTSGTQNPFTSFAVETGQVYASGQNLIRYYKGCMVDNLTISANQGEALNFAVDFVAKTLDFSSGGMTLTASEPTQRPYIYANTQISIPSGTAIDAKNWSLAIANTIDRDGAHICNGSREIGVPTPTERNYTLNTTMDGESTEAARLYGIWKSGGDASVNAIIKFNNVYNVSASGTSTMTLSGCIISEFNAPNPVEGIDEWSLTLLPKSASAIIQDQTLKYLSW